jgi:zinc finger protein
MSEEDKQKFFPTLNETVESQAAGQSEGADNDAISFSNSLADDNGITSIPNTLCVECGETGTTNMILTSIPFFREFIIMSFTCDECGFRSSDANFSGTLQERGCRHELSVQHKEDLDRQVIKSDSATIIIPELQFEIPAKVLYLRL